MVVNYDAAKIFSPPKLVAEPVHEDFEAEWSIDSGALCAVTGKKGELLNVTEQSVESVLQDFAEVLIRIGNGSNHVHPAAQGRSQICVRTSGHPASASSWNISCVRLANFSGIYSVDFDGMRLFTNSWTIHG